MHSSPWAATALPLSRANDATRVEYLRKVALLTLGGLALSAISATLSAGLIMAAPGLLGNRIAQLVVLFGSYGLAHVVARGMVFSQSAATRVSGFLLGSVSQGVAMGYLLLVAVITATSQGANPLLFIGQAMGLVSMTAVGMLFYLLTGPKQLSWVRGMMAMMSLPMLGLMVLSFVFPIGGPLGMLMSVAFVGMSAAGLMYQMNAVVHTMRTDQHIAGAYTITMGLLVLFWNVLSLLLRMQRR